MLNYTESSKKQKLKDAVIILNDFEILGKELENCIVLIKSKNKWKQLLLKWLYTNRNKHVLAIPWSLELEVRYIHDYCYGDRFECLYEYDY